MRLGARHAIKPMQARHNCHKAKATAEDKEFVLIGGNPKLLRWSVEAAVCRLFAA